MYSTRLNLEGPESKTPRLKLNYHHFRVDPFQKNAHQPFCAASGVVSCRSFRWGHVVDMFFEGCDMGYTGNGDVLV